MSHATEGELHAWADGAVGSLDPDRAERLAAHLRSCPDCRTRLEEARGLRERAAGILGRAYEGRVEPPPFEALRARATSASSGASGGAPPRREGRGAPPLAWAASVLLAIGAGWLGHAVWSEEAGSAARAPSPTPAEASRVARAVPDEGTGATGDAPAGRAVAEAPAEDAAAARDATAGERAGPRDAPRAPARARERAAAAERRVAVAEPETSPAPATPERTAARPDSEAAPGRREAPGAAPERQVIGADPESRKAPVAALALDGAEARVWLPVGPGDAARWLGAEPPRVPGLPVTDVAISSLDEAPIARIGQRLPGGERIEIVVERLTERDEAVAPEELRIRAAERETLAAAPGETADERAKSEEGALEIVVAGFRIRISAPLAADSLHALLSRVR